MKNLRLYGKRPYTMAVIHGGPGAPGEMAPVARELSAEYGVLEPLQTKDTLDGQVEELRDVLQANGEPPVILIGFSWGAWLSFIVAAGYPALVRKLILVGSGPFEEKYADSILPTRLERLSEAERVEFCRIVEGLSEPATGDKAGLMARFGSLMDKADTYDPLPRKVELLEFNYEVNQKVWDEAARLRASGELLKLANKIRCPVVAIHGDYDPHPAGGVRVPLSGALKDFKFILLEKCGHEPWIERWARDRFYEILRNELKCGYLK
jgi:pimeloyl-ACP methyl ester carboxylesterase